MLTPEQELAEIEWVNGLGEMPAHLVERGTVRRVVTHMMMMCGTPVARFYPDGGTFDLGVVDTVQYRELPLVEPFVETYVWGELTSRSPLPKRHLYSV